MNYLLMECRNIDFIGPFADGDYFLVIIDTYTTWVELFHTKDSTAALAANCRFGAPLHFVLIVGHTLLLMS